MFVCHPCLSVAVWYDHYYNKGKCSGLPLHHRWEAVGSQTLTCPAASGTLPSPPWWGLTRTCPGLRVLKVLRQPQLQSVSETHSLCQSVGQSVSPLQGLCCHRAEEYSILHVSHSTALHYFRQLSTLFLIIQLTTPPILPPSLSSSFRESQLSLKMAGQGVPHLHTVITGLYKDRCLSFWK